MATLQVGWSGGHLAGRVAPYELLAGGLAGLEGVGGLAGGQDLHLGDGGGDGGGGGAPVRRLARPPAGGGRRAGARRRWRRRSGR